MAEILGKPRAKNPSHVFTYNSECLDTDSVLFGSFDMNSVHVLMHINMYCLNFTT